MIAPSRPPYTEKRALFLSLRASAAPPLCRLRHTKGKHARLFEEEETKGHTTTTRRETLSRSLLVSADTGRPRLVAIDASAELAENLELLRLVRRGEHPVRHRRHVRQPGRRHHRGQQPGVQPAIFHLVSRDGRGAGDECASASVRRRAARECGDRVLRLHFGAASSGRSWEQDGLF